MNKRLNVVEIEKASSESSSSSLLRRRREDALFQFEHMWKSNPEQFNPFRNCMERERIAKTWELIREACNPEGKKAVDLGCGQGVLATKLCENGAHTHAVDIAEIPLKKLAENNIAHLTTSQDYVPRTILKEDAYDIVISTELIAYLPADEYRLYFSELARLVKLNGFVICSTPIDFNSEDALQRFANLAETEFQIEKWVLSYHYLYIRILDLIKSPREFAHASKDPRYRAIEIYKRNGLKQWWFRVNSRSFPGALWALAEYVFNPIVRYMERSPKLMLKIGKVCRFIWPDSGISHAIFIAKRRPLVVQPPANEIPVERRQKRQVWE